MVVPGEIAGRGGVPAGFSSRDPDAFLTPPPRGSSPAATLPSFRPYRPDDPGFLTVEPDGHHGIGFMDRLRHALDAVFSRLRRSRDADESLARVVEALRKPIADAEAAGQAFAVQIRLVGIDVAFADRGADDQAAFASYRQLGLEIGVARGGKVRAGDVQVLGLDGRSQSLTPEQVRAGLITGNYRRNTVAGDVATLPESARRRLETAQAGLARVKAMQDALKAYRSGDTDPLKQLLIAEGDPAGQRFGAVFPGIGPLAVG